MHIQTGPRDREDQVCFELGVVSRPEGRGARPRSQGCISRCTGTRRLPFPSRSWWATTQLCAQPAWYCQAGGGHRLLRGTTHEAFYAHLVKTKEWSDDWGCWVYWISNLKGGSTAGAALSTFMVSCSRCGVELRQSGQLARTAFSSLREAACHTLTMLPRLGFTPGIPCGRRAKTKGCISPTIGGTGCRGEGVVR